jgi:hypothetical protein
MDPERSLGRKMDLLIEDEDGQRRVEFGTVLGKAGICVVDASKRFEVGERISLSATGFPEICWSFFFYTTVWETAAKCESSRSRRPTRHA